MTTDTLETPAPADTALQCEYSLCETPASWSVLFTCGESIAYCLTHEVQIRRMSNEGHVSCDCPGVTKHIPIQILMRFPLRR